MPSLTEEEKLIWLGLKSTVAEDTFAGGGGTPTDDNGDPLETDDGGPLAGIRVHETPGQSYDGIAVPAGTTEVFGQRLEFSSRNPVPASETPDTEPVTDPPTSGDFGEPGGDGTGVGDPEAQGITFDTTLDAVDDLGLDNTGSTPINDQLLGAIADSTLIEFPSGAYRIDPHDNDGKGLLINGVTNFGMRGSEGQQRTDVKFQLPPETAGNAIVFGSGASRTYLANCVLDQSTDPGTNIQITINQNGKHYQYNTAHVGKTAPNQDTYPGGEDTNAIGVSMGSGANCRIENYQKIDPLTRLVDYPANQITIQAPRDHQGSLDVVNGHMANSGEHSLYCSRTVGPVRVTGGLYQNNINTNMRICGEGSYLKDATILVDMDPQQAIESDTGDPQAVRGIWWEAGSYGKSGGYIENCEIIYTAQTGVCPGVIRIEGTAGGMEVRDTTIRNETDHPTVFVERIGEGPGGATPPKPWAIAFKNCTFEGASPSPPVANVGDREVTLENCAIDMPNAAQPRGVEIVDGG